MTNVFRTDVLSGFGCANIVADWSRVDLASMTDVELVDLTIEKWHAVRAAFDGIPDGARVNDGGVRTCALCQVYYDDGACTRCPITRYTGAGQCRETPYLEWAWKPCPANADDEIEFLERLKAHLEQQRGENDEQP